MYIKETYLEKEAKTPIVQSVALLLLLDMDFQYLRTNSKTANAQNATRPLMAFGTN